MRLCHLAFASVLAIGAVTTLGPTVAVADNENRPCKIATKGETPTAQACARGGMKEAVKSMKQAVKLAKAKGVKFICDDCHKNGDDYALTDNAKNDYEKLLAITK